MSSGSGALPARLDGPDPFDRLYRLLAENLQDHAVFLLDPGGHIMSWPAGAARLKGYRAEDILGRHYRIFYTEEARTAGDPDVQLELAARDGRFEGEGWRIRKGGERFWARVVITALREDGELRGFGKVTTDRTAEHEGRNTLVRRERQLEEAQKIAHLGSWEWDVERDSIRWSDELYRIMGVEPGEPIAYEAYLQLLHETDRSRVREKVRTTLETGERYVHEHRIVRPDGEQRWVQSRGELVRVRGDRPRLVGTTLDITELKEAEARVRQLSAEQAAREEAERTAQRLRFLAEASALLSGSLDYHETLTTLAWLAIPSFADWCAVDMLEEDGQLRRLAVAHMDPERMQIAQDMHDQYGQSPDAEHGVHKVIRSGEPDLLESISPALLESLARDERHLRLIRELDLTSAIIVPIRIHDRSMGAITFANAESQRRYTQEDLVVARELASRAALAIENAQLHGAEKEARLHAERAEERTSRLQAITAELSEALTPDAVADAIVEQGTAALDAASGALALLRPEGAIEFVRALGAPPDIMAEYETVGLDTNGPVAEAIRSGEIVAIDNVRSHRERYPELEEVRARIGTRSLVAVPLRSGGGAIGALYFGYEDDRPFRAEDREFLTALAHQCAQALERAWLFETEHLAREAAEEASRTKSQFVAMVSHELRTPLSAIIGYQELLSEEVSGPVNERQREHLHRIRASASHLRDLINQVLTASSVESGKEEVFPEDVDAAELTRDIATLLKQEAARKGLLLEIAVPDVPVPMRVDAGKLRQILLNLVSNAIKFTEEGGVTVLLEATEQDVEIRVEDTGIGIDEHDRERIFEMFTQVDQSMTRKAGGSGLGLPVSRRLAKLMGGDLQLEDRPERGSTFSLRLPRESH